MQSELLIAIVSGLTTMIGWGLADFFAKKTIDKIGDIVTLFWAHVFGTMFFALIVLFQTTFATGPLSFPSDFHVWVGLVFFGALQGTVYLLVYQGFGKGKLAILNPVFASYSGMAALLSILFLGEVVPSYILGAIVAVFIGVIFLSLDLQALRARNLHLVGAPGLKEVGIASILAAIWTLSWNSFVKGADWVFYAFVMYAFMTLSIFIYTRIKKIGLEFNDTSSWKYLALIGGCETIAYLMLSLGFSTTSYTSVIAVLSGAFSLPTIVLAWMFLKERISLIQTVGCFIIIAGIIILSLR